MRAFVVRHPKISGRQVSKCHVVPMTAQSMERSGHPQLGVQRFRSEDQKHAFGQGQPEPAGLNRRHSAFPPGQPVMVC